MVDPMVNPSLFTLKLKVQLNRVSSVIVARAKFYSFLKRLIIRLSNGLLCLTGMNYEL